MMILRFPTTRLSRRTTRRLLSKRDPKLPRMPRRATRKRPSPLLASRLIKVVSSLTPSKLADPPETKSKPREVVAKEEAAVAEAVSGVKEEERLAVVAEVDNSIRDLEPPSRLMPRVTKLLMSLPREREVMREETEAEMEPSMRASIREMAPVRPEEAVAERAKTEPRTSPKKRPRKKLPSKKKRRSLNLNMKRLFLVKISMISSVLRDWPEELSKLERPIRLRVTPKPIPLSRSINLPLNKTDT